MCKYFLIFREKWGFWGDYWLPSDTISDKDSGEMMSSYKDMIGKWKRMEGMEKYLFSYTNNYEWIRMIVSDNVWRERMAEPLGDWRMTLA